MLYSILIYGSETVVGGWTEQEESVVMARHAEVRQELTAQRKLGPVFRLMPTTAATTLRPGSKAPVIDGPFAETKEQLLGIYVVACGRLEEAIEVARGLSFDSGVFEIRPIATFEPGSGIKSSA